MVLRCADGETIRKAFEVRTGHMFVTNRRIVLEGGMEASIGFGDLLSYGAVGKRRLSLVWGRERNVVKIRMASEPAEMVVGFIMSALDGETAP